MRGDRRLYALALGALALVAITDVLPSLYVIAMSFSPVRGSHAGAYRVILRDSVFARSLLNTALFSLGSAVFQIAVGLALARAISHLSRKAQTWWFMVLLAPWLMSEMASVVLWRGILMADVGHLDRWVHTLGLPSLRLLAGSRTALPALVIVATWQGIGFTTLFLLGALSAIPRNLYRAASVSGLGSCRTLVCLELPLLTPALAAGFVAVAMRSAGQFALPARLTMGGPMHTTTMASTYLLERLLIDPTPAIAAAGGSVVLAAFVLVGIVVWRLRWAGAAAA
ncbi:sugar ABC transporter permease [Candidatus Fermentibacteria bacterium]|nr:sugar ABC transporter permease [Candidatus Fermentibacteria bacterium]